MCQNDADGMASNVDPGCRSSLIWVYTVYSGLSVRKFWNAMVLQTFGLFKFKVLLSEHNIWAAPSEFVSSSIPSSHTLTAHAQPFRGARDLAFCLKVPLDSLLL